MATVTWIITTGVVAFVGGFVVCKYIEYRKNK